MENGIPVENSENEGQIVTQDSETKEETAVVHDRELVKEETAPVQDREVQEETVPACDTEAKLEIVFIENTGVQQPEIVNIPNQKVTKLPKKKKDHSIKFTRTEEKISEEDEIQIEETEFHNTMREDEKGCCGLKNGPHITFLSVLFIPCALISSLCVSFYYGAWTWYNLYIYFSEEKTVWHKVTICPLLILTFPFTVGLSSLCVAIFAAFIQLSWYFRSWKAEIFDFDKGFYGWLCDKLGLSQCSPYEMISLNDDSELENLPVRS